MPLAPAVVMDIHGSGFVSMLQLATIGPVMGLICHQIDSCINYERQ
jgi:hypothetical protein